MPIIDGCPEKKKSERIIYTDSLGQYVFFIEQKSKEIDVEQTAKEMAIIQNQLDNDFEDAMDEVFFDEEDI